MTFFKQPFINGERCGRLLATLALLLVGNLFVLAQLPEEIPDPNRGNPDNFIADPYRELSASTVKFVNSKLKELRKNTTIEVGVAVIKTTGDLSIEDYAYRLFDHWEIGQKDTENGLLLIFATDDRSARIEVGSGAEGVVTDIAAAKILQKGVVPPLKGDNVNQAVSNAVDMICDTFSDPSMAEELRSSNPVSAMDGVKRIDRAILWQFLGIVVFCVFLFMLVMFLIDFFSARKRDHYRRAMTWYPHLPTYWWGALFSCGLALPIALLAWRLYRHSRDVKEVCDTCGAKMNRLSEDEDNAFLSASQDFEEKLGTVDYDVWLCPECGTVERFPYVERQLKYHKCPECGTIAMNLVMDKVVVPPTTTHDGHGERLYQCQFCRHVRREGYKIDKLPDPAKAALAAGAITGILGRGSGSGFPSGPGGGFGGGHSSGGGASAHW